MIKEYEKLSSISKSVLDYPGKGGNISVKNDSYMIVKASGEDLKNKEHDKSYVNLNGVILEPSAKPSMEYKMHLSIPFKYVMHYHPVYVLPYLCSDHIFNDGETLDYYQPGEDLFNAVDIAAKRDPANKIFYLRNHGVVIASDDLEELKNLYESIKSKFFIKETTAYTPDDAVDENSGDLWLFRHYIDKIQKEKTLNKLTLSDKQTTILRKDVNEIFRKEKM